MKKNNYLLSFSLLLALGMINKSNAQEALKASSAGTETKAAISTGFLALEGKVLDKEGNAVAFALVTLKGTDRTVQADAYGNYRFSELQAGNYTVLATGDGFQDAEMQLTLEMPKLKLEQTKNFCTPNNKSINASPVIRDVIMRRSAV